MAVSNPIIAIILVITMLLSPAASVENGVELPKTTITLINDQGEVIAFGSVDTTKGLPALFFDILDSGMIFTGESTYYNEEGTNYVFHSAALLQSIAAAAQAFTPPTEEELNALTALAEEIVKDISPEAVNIALAEGGLKVDVDVDKLAKDLHTAVPMALLQHGSRVDGLLNRYAGALLGEEISCMNLAEAWLEMGLDELETGVKAQLEIQQGEEGLLIKGAACGAGFEVNIGESRFAFCLTAADGTAYHLDTDDLGMLAYLFASVPSAITEEAFSITQERGKIAEEGSMDFAAYAQEGEIKPVEHDAYITTINLDTGALARDLNNGIVNALTANKDMLDMLLNKYRSWFALMDEDVAAQLTADVLIEIAQMGVIELPEEKGQLKVTVTSAFGARTTVEGFFGGYTLKGIVYENPNLCGQFVLAEDTLSNPFELRLDYSVEGGSYEQDVAVSLSSNEKIFDLFHSLNFSMTTERYMTSWKLTTDTDVLHAAYSDAETYLEAKIGAFSAYLDVDENDAVHCGFSLPEFFVDLHAADSNFSLDSSVLGLDYSEDYDGFVLNGYFCEDADSEERLCFGLSSGNYGLEAYIKDNWSTDIAFSGNGNAVSFRNGYDTYTLLPDYQYAGDRLQIVHNGSLENLVEVVEEGAKLSFFIYRGMDTSAVPVLTIIIDTAPAPIELPEDATELDLEQFMVKMEEYFQ